MAAELEYVPVSPRVLHVDDDSSFAEVTQTFLERELPNEMVVESVTDPTEVLDRLANERFDCVISDYEMPGMDGLTLLEEIREIHPDMPFLLYTGKGSETIASKAINAGVTGYFQKGGADQQRRLANRAEHAIEEYRAKLDSRRYSTILEALDYPTYVVDADGRFAHVNEAFAQLTGYSQGELIGNEPAVVKSEASVERANEALRTVVSSTGPDTDQFGIEIQTKDGETIHCRDHLAPLPFDEEYQGCAGILRDTTAEHKRRTELERQNERLEEFVSVVSHDLRIPLATAQSAVELAQETGEAEYFEMLECAHDRIDQMLDELLTLAREGETVGTTEDTSLGAVAERAWNSVGSSPGQFDVATDVTVEADPDRFRRLLENLFRNALDHGGSDVAITVGELSHAEGFYVADDGSGIPSDDRETVFEPGYTTAEDGTGFGLSIVRRIADAHGWEITVTESVDGGARFEFAGVTVQSNPTVELD